MTAMLLLGHVGADKLLPRGRALPLGSRRDAMALEDVAHRLVADRQAHVGQRADNAVIAPGTILLGYTHDQGLQLWINPGASRRLTLRRAVKFLGHELPVPAKNRVRLDDRGHVLESLLPELLATLGQGFAFAIRQPQPARDLVAQDAILCHQILVTQQQSLIDSPRDIRQQLFPVHHLSPASPRHEFIYIYAE